uniref:Uncharacterized protein n=1 Tax=Oryza glumipatula TaxID=40148 RepID=A0A0D9ZGF3_9ORYZ
MDLAVFFTFVVARRKEVDALKRCVDPARFAMVDKRAVRSPLVPQATCERLFSISGNFTVEFMIRISHLGTYKIFRIRLQRRGALRYITTLRPNLQKGLVEILNSDTSVSSNQVSVATKDEYKPQSTGAWALRLQMI